MTKIISYTTRMPVRSSFEVLANSQFNSFIDTFFKDAFTTKFSASKDSYPKYNIIKHKDENKITTGFTVELSLAGFAKESFKIYTNKNTLYVTLKDDIEERDVDYVYKGIASRNFKWSLPLPKHANIGKITFVNGILSIEVEINIPEEEKPKVYSID